MGLPRLNTVEYFETLPVSKIEVKYRPFNVGEQKVLLQAIEEGEQKDKGPLAASPQALVYRKC